LLSIDEERMRKLIPTLLLALGAIVAPVGAQRPPTTIVALSPRVADELAAAYRPNQEQTWRVVAWDSTTAHADYVLITVTGVEYVGLGESHRVGPAQVASTPAGVPLIHSHSPGNCQASPADRETAVQRGSRFDGILCGDRYTTFYFASAIAAEVNYRFLMAQSVP
jgi:hypothetical protein